MTKKITHKFTLPDGTTVKRESATRRYTHVIISRYTQADKDRDLIKEKASLAKTEAKLADEAGRKHYFETQVVGVKHLADWTIETLRGQDVENHANAVKRVAQIEAIEVGPDNGWACEGWSQSFANASKAGDKAAKYRGQVRVHEVTDIVEREVKKTSLSSKLSKAQQAILDAVTAAGDAGADLHSDHGSRVISNVARRGLIDGRMVDGEAYTLTDGSVAHRREYRFFLKAQS
jgi:hypothetical protein